MLPPHTWRTNRRGAPPSRQDAPAKALRNRDIFLPTPPSPHRIRFYPRILIHEKHIIVILLQRHSHADVIRLPESEIFPTPHKTNPSIPLSDDRHRPVGRSIIDYHKVRRVIRIPNTTQTSFDPRLEIIRNDHRQDPRSSNCYLVHASPPLFTRLFNIDSISRNISNFNMYAPPKYKTT